MTRQGKKEKEERESQGFLRVRRGGNKRAGTDIVNIIIRVSKDGLSSFEICFSLLNMNTTVAATSNDLPFHELN